MTVRNATIGGGVLIVAAALAVPALSGLPGIGGLWQDVVVWVLEQQRALHRELAGHLRAVAGERSFEAGLGLIVASFLYGVFHAAGPGHGKAVIATYLMTQRQTVARGVTLAAASAALQGVIAIALVYGLTAIVGIAASGTTSAVVWSERASYLIVALLGTMLAMRAINGGWQAWRRRSHGLRSDGDGHDHHHHRHGHEGCHHHHGPRPEQVEQVRDLRTGVAVVFSVGLRPCSGAILVLALANAIGLAAAGIGAVAAMSVGTAITVAALAFLSVHARELAVRLAAAGTPVRVAGLTRTLSLVGGVVILALGISLFLGSWGAGHPLMR